MGKVIMKRKKLTLNILILKQIKSSKSERSD